MNRIFIEDAEIKAEAINILEAEDIRTDEDDGGRIMISDEEFSEAASILEYADIDFEII